MATSNWPVIPCHSEAGSATIHFRPPRRRYTPQSTLMTLSRFAPMIDLSFLLLIFFMTTTRFAQPEGLLSSRMQARASSGVALPFSPIVIRLTAAGPANADVAVAIDRFEGAPQALPKLPDFLRSIQTQPGFDRDTPVVLVGADEVRWDHVVGAWNAALRAGFKSIAFAEP